MIDHTWKPLTNKDIQQHNEMINGKEMRSFNDYLPPSAFMCENCGQVLAAKYVLPKSTVDFLMQKCEDRILKEVMVG